MKLLKTIILYTTLILLGLFSTYYLFINIVGYQKETVLELEWHIGRVAINLKREDINAIIIDLVDDKRSCKILIFSEDMETYLKQSNRATIKARLIIEYRWWRINNISIKQIGSFQCDYNRLKYQYTNCHPRYFY